MCLCSKWVNWYFVKITYPDAKCNQSKILEGSNTAEILNNMLGQSFNKNEFELIRHMHIDSRNTDDYD